MVVHLTSVMPGRKRFKPSARAATIDGEPEGLTHDASLDIVMIPNQNLPFVDRSNENPTTKPSDLVVLRDYFDTKSSALEAKITNDAQAVSKELGEMFNSHIKTVAGDNEFKKKKKKLEQTLKQKLKKEANLSFSNKGNKLQY